MTAIKYGPAQSQNERNLTERKFAPSENGLITSLEIAEISGKNHKDLLRSIRSQEVAWNEINGRNFTLVDYLDQKGQKRPMYELTMKESLYIIAKFDDMVRAKLVRRWHELETRTHQKPKLFPHEMPLFETLNKYLIIGDIKKVAEETSVTPGHVSKVKNGNCRSLRVMKALMATAMYNKQNAITDGYPQKWVQTTMAFVNPQQRLFL